MSVTVNQIPGLVNDTRLADFQQVTDILDRDFLLPLETAGTAVIADSLHGNVALIALHPHPYSALRDGAEIALGNACGLLCGFLELAGHEEFLFNFLCHNALFVCERLVGHSDDSLDCLEIIDILDSLETTVSDGLLDVFNLGGLGVDGNDLGAVDEHVAHLADGIVDHIAETLLVHPYGGEIRIGLHHCDEFIVSVGVLVKSRHFHHECREDFLLQNLAGDREFALHQRIPLLEAVNSLDVGLDVHLAVADLGVVDVILAGDDVNLVAFSLPYFLRDRNGQSGHSLVGLAETLSE